MSKPARSAELIMKLYELRRDDRMREARSWFISFFPESTEEIMHTLIDPATSANYRMVVSYWDMAAGFVNSGAIDEEMFLDSGGEAIITFAKVHPYLEGLRTALGSPKYLNNLEKLIMKQPDAEEMLAARRETMKRWMQARAELVKSA